MIAPVPVHCFSITFTTNSISRYAVSGLSQRVTLQQASAATEATVAIGLNFGAILPLSNVLIGVGVLCGISYYVFNYSYVSLSGLITSVGEEKESIFEPRYEKTGYLQMRKQRRRSAAHWAADQRLCCRYMDSTIPPLSKSESSSL